MTDYNDGQPHIWHGGECPVHPRTEVKIWFRSDLRPNPAAWAGGEDWMHTGRNSDIIAFQVTKPYVEQVDDSQPINPAAIREAALREAAEVARTFGVWPELNIWGNGPEWYQHGRRIANAIETLIGETKC